MEKHFEAIDDRERRLSVEERLNHLDNLMKATLIITDPNSTEEEQEIAHGAREQSCYILNGKSWNETKEELLREWKERKKE